MKKEAGWLSSRCVLSVLLELANKPLTPMLLRTRTGMTKNNYVNIILRKLEAEDIAMCLTPDSRIGKVFCINPKGIDRVKKIFRKKKLYAHINSIPDLNWEAYGILLCQYCTQLRTVFKKANELRQEGRELTVPNLNKMKLPKMATSDIHRALKRLIELQLMICDDAKPKRFIVTKEGLSLIEYAPGTLLI